MRGVPVKRERGGGGRAREPVPKVLTNVLFFVSNSVHTMLIHVATDCIAPRCTGYSDTGSILEISRTAYRNPT